MQVLLEGLSDEVLTQRLEEAHLRGLALKESKHAPRNADDREMLVILSVVLGWPFQDVVHLSQVLAVFKALFSVAWNINSWDALELSLQHGLVHAIVNGHDSSPSSLQEICVWRLKETVVCRWLVDPVFWQRLRQNTNDRLIGLRADMMSLVSQDWLAQVAAQVVQPVAIYKKSSVMESIEKI